MAEERQAQIQSIAGQTREHVWTSLHLVLKSMGPVEVQVIVRQLAAAANEYPSLRDLEFGVNQSLSGEDL